MTEYEQFIFSSIMEEEEKREEKRKEEKRKEEKKEKDIIEKYIGLDNSPLIEKDTFIEKKVFTTKILRCESFCPKTKTAYRNTKISRSIANAIDYRSSEKGRQMMKNDRKKRKQYILAEIAKI